MVWWTQMFHPEDLCSFIFLFKVQGEHSRSSSSSSSSSLFYVWCVSSVVIGEHLHPEVMWQFWKATGASFTHELWSFPGKLDQSSVRLSDWPAFWQTFHFIFWRFLWNKRDIKNKHVTQCNSGCIFLSNPTESERLGAEPRIWQFYLP